MTLTPYEREVLDLVVEDDYGLWEVRRRLDTAFGPSASERRTEMVLRSLLSKGLVTVQREVGTEVSENSSAGDSVVDLADRDSWREPVGGEPVLTVTATESGHKVYSAGAPAN